MPDFKDARREQNQIPDAGAIRQNDGMYHQPDTTVGAPQGDPLKPVGPAKPYADQIQERQPHEQQRKPDLSKDPAPAQIPVADDGQRFDYDKKPADEKEQKVGAGAKIHGLGSRAAAGIEHAARATGESIQSATGTLNAVDMLLHQHKETMHLFDRIENNKDPKARHRLLEDMCDGLVARMRVEEELFYPAMAHEGLRTWEHVAQSVQEHNGVKNIMTQLLQLNPADAIFESKLIEFKKDLDAHVQEERSVFFPQVKEKLENKRLKELGKEMHNMYSKLMGEKHTRYLAFEDVGKPVPTKETREPAHKS